MISTRIVLMSMLTLPLCLLSCYGGNAPSSSVSVTPNKEKGERTTSAQSPTGQSKSVSDNKKRQPPKVANESQVNLPPQQALKSYPLPEPIRLPKLSLATSTVQQAVVEEEEGPRVIDLVAREFSDFEYQFSPDELGTDSLVTIEGLPDDASYDPASRILKWCPLEESKDEELLISAQSNQSRSEPIVKVVLHVQRAYQRPVHLEPVSIPPLSNSLAISSLEQQLRSIFDFKVSPKMIPGRWDSFDKHCKMAASKCSNDFRIEMAKSLRILSSETLATNDYRKTMDSLSKVIDTSESRYLAAIYLRLWVLVLHGRIDDAIAGIPDYVKSIVKHQSVSEQEVQLRLYELGSLVAYLESKARQHQVNDLEEQIDLVHDSFINSDKNRLIFQDGINRVRAIFREEQDGREARRAKKEAEKSDKLQALNEKGEQIAADLAALDRKLQVIKTNGDNALAQLDEKLTPFYKKKQDIDREYQAWSSDRDVCVANYEGYLATMQAAQASGNDSQITSAQRNLSAIEARAQALDRQGRQIKQRYEDNEREYQPLLRERVTTHNKWSSEYDSKMNEKNQLLKLQARNRTAKGKAERKSLPSSRISPSLKDTIPLDIDFERSCLIQTLK